MSDTAPRLEWRAILMDGNLKVGVAVTATFPDGKVVRRAAKQFVPVDMATMEPLWPKEVIADLRERFDWVICDSPAGIERGATLAMRFADLAVVVANPEVSSVRDSDRIIGLLDSKTIKAERGERIEKFLLLTRYDAARAARGDMLSVEDVLDILSIPLLGIVPESKDVLRASNIGAPVSIGNLTSPAAIAYIDAARRLGGVPVPLIRPVERKSLFGRIFTRRAA